jgi:hypothetical protein
MNESVDGSVVARGAFLIALWFPAVFFILSATSNVLPLSRQAQIRVADLGFLAGTMSVFSTPVAAALTYRWWSTLPKLFRAILAIVAVIASVALLLWILAYANPFFSNA